MIALPPWWGNYKTVLVLHLGFFDASDNIGQQYAAAVLSHACDINTTEHFQLTPGISAGICFNSGYDSFSTESNKKIVGEYSCNLGSGDPWDKGQSIRFRDDLYPDPNLWILLHNINNNSINYDINIIHILNIMTAAAATLDIKPFDPFNARWSKLLLSKGFSPILV